MGSIVLGNGRKICDYSNPYIVAEVNSSHNGDLDVARKMIEAAADIGCDCVKFQSWSANSLYSKTYYDSNPIAKRFVNKFAIKPSDLKELAQFCKSRGIDFSSTAYCEEELDFLVNECEAPFIKVSSMEINNLPYLEYVGKKNIPVVLSTGMSEFSEVERAVEVLKNCGNSNLVLLHCVSLYPTVLETVNLNNILGLRERFPNCSIGFSDHTYGDEAAVAAVALGASFLEKHLTLDRSKVGMDNGMATEPKEFGELVKKCRSISIAMGGKDRIVSEEELEQRKNMRRSIVLLRDIKAGEKVTREIIYSKRPGTGIAPDCMDSIIGKRALHDIEADTIVSYSDFE